MLIEIVIFCVGFIVGIMFASERYYKGERRTFEQVDKEVRDELILQRNLVNSLKEDVLYLRKKLSTFNGS